MAAEHVDGTGGGAGGFEQLRLFEPVPTGPSGPVAPGLPTGLARPGRGAWELPEAVIAAQEAPGGPRVPEPGHEPPAAPAGPQRPPAGRWRGLDVARGAAVAGMILVENLPYEDRPTFSWFRHPAWDGLTFADLVFPAFVALVGVGLAVSGGPGRGTRAERVAKVVRRALTLVVLGLLFNAWSGAGADLSHLRVPGVLARLGVVGLAVAAVVALCRRQWVAVAAAALVVAGGYGWVLAHLGVDGCRGTGAPPACTVPGRVDQAVFGADHLYRGGASNHDPEGLVSTSGAVVTALVGWVAGDRLRRRGRATAGRLAALAAVVAAAGVVFPGAALNKRLWTPSFALVTAGCAVGLLALAHAGLDARPGAAATRAGRALTWPLAVLGRNALVVYIGQHVVNAALERTMVGEVSARTWLVDRVAEGWVARPGALMAYAVAATVAWTAVAAAMHAARWYVTL